MIYKIILCQNITLYYVCFYFYKNKEKTFPFLQTLQKIINYLKHYYLLSFWPMYPWWEYIQTHMGSMLGNRMSRQHVSIHTLYQAFCLFIFCKCWPVVFWLAFWYVSTIIPHVVLDVYFTNTIYKIFHIYFINLIDRAFLKLEGMLNV